MTVSGLHMSELTDGFCLRLGEKGNQSSSSGEAGDESPDSGAAAWWYELY